jgi:hypothetical protein
VVQRLRNRYYCLFWVDQAKNKKILPRAKKNKQKNKIKNINTIISCYLAIRNHFRIVVQTSIG